MFSASMLPRCNKPAAIILATTRTVTIYAAVIQIPVPNDFLRSLTVMRM